MDSDNLTIEQPTHEKQPRKRRTVILIFLFLLLLCAAGCAWYWFDTSSQALTPGLSAQPVKPLPPARQHTEKKKENPGKDSVMTGSPSKISIPEFGNLEDYAKLDAQEALLEKKKRVLALENDIKRLKAETNGGADKEKAPQISQTDVRMLIAQEMERVAPEEKKKSEGSPSVASEARSSRFISIQGVGDTMVASIRGGDGKIVKLTRGSDYAGGKVVKITRSGVTINRKGKQVFYPF